MIVVDASVLVDSFIGDIAAAARIGGQELHAPHLIDLEVASALRRLAATGRIDDSAGRSLMAALADAGLHRHGHRELLGPIWELRNNLNSYDAAYVALATALDAPLITTDTKLAGAPGLTCAVELI